MQSGIAGRNLGDFVRAFDVLYAQLKTIDLPLFFQHDPTATLWSKGKKT
jgi:hypothetical protein